MSRRARYTPLGDDVPGVNVGVGVDENEGEREDGRVRVARAGLPSPLTPPLPPAALAADGAAGHPSLRRRTAWGARAGPGAPPGGGGGWGGGGGGGYPRAPGGVPPLPTPRTVAPPCFLARPGLFRERRRAGSPLLSASGGRALTLSFPRPPRPQPWDPRFDDKDIRPFPYREVVQAVLLLGMGTLFIVIALLQHHGHVGSKPGQVRALGRVRARSLPSAPSAPPRL